MVKRLCYTFVAETFNEADQYRMPIISLEQFLSEIGVSCQQENMSYVCFFIRKDNENQ